METSSRVRRNYLAFVLEGGFFFGAFAFVQPQMIMPRVVESLHGPLWVISLMPVLMSIGYGLPPFSSIKRSIHTSSEPSG